MKTIKIAEDLSLPVDLVSQTIALLAKRGMGKTYAGGVMVEGMAEIGAQVVVLDPTDAWWGLKSSADGKSEGYPFIIFGGNHSDVPLVAESGKTLAEFVVESGHSVIICTRLLSKAKARQFVADFFEHLYHIKGQKNKNQPLFCMIDECDLFVPQMVTFETAKCVGAIDDVVRRGRNVGLGVGLISQRAAKVNKDVLSQVEVLIALQTGGAHDRKALQEWIEANADADKMKEFISNLVKLQRGEAWIWSPSWLQILQPITFRKKTTFDSSYTPKSGETRITPRKLAQVDLKKLTKDIQDTVERTKANDPAELIKKLAAATKTIQQLTDAKTPKHDAKMMVVKNVPMLTEAESKRFTKVIHTFERIEKMLNEEKIEKLIRDVYPSMLSIKACLEGKAAPVPPAIRPQADRIRQTHYLPPPKQIKTVIEPSDGELDNAQQKILDTVAMLKTRGLTPNRDMLARWHATANRDGLHPSGGTFGQNLAKLRAGGYLEGCELTEKGRAIARNIESGLDAAKRTVDQSQERIMEQLEEGQKHDRDSLAAALGLHPSGGTYGQNLARLRCMGLLPDRGTIMLTEAAFK